MAAPLLTLALLASCGGGDGGGGDAAKTTAGPTTAAAPTTGTTTAGSSDAPASSGPQAVEIKGFAFNPDTLTVKVGTKVTWNNADSATHTVTADEKEFDSKSTKKGASFSFTFIKAGTFKYHCEIHPTMTATITVE